MTVLTVDKKGRLLIGPRRLVEGALSRENANQKSGAYDSLAPWAKDIPSKSLLWIVGSDEMVSTLLGASDELKGTRISGLYLSLLYSEDEGPVLQSAVYCPTNSDAKTCQEALEGDRKRLEKMAEKGFTLSWENRLMVKSQFHVTGNQVHMSLSVPIGLLRIGSEAMTNKFIQENYLVEAKVGQEFWAKMEQGGTSLRRENYSDAAEAFSRALELVPGNPTAKRGLQDARTGLEVMRQFETAIQGAASALAGKDIVKAKAQLLIAQKLRPRDSRLSQIQAQVLNFEQRVELERIQAERNAAFQRFVQQGNDALEKGLGADALDAFRSALKLRPEDVGLQEVVSTVTSVQGARSELKLISKSLVMDDISKAYHQAKKLQEIVSRRLSKNVAVDKRFSRMLRDLGDETTRHVGELFNRLTESATAEKEKAEEALKKKDFSRALEAYEKAVQGMVRALGFVGLLKNSCPTAEVAKWHSKGEEAQSVRGGLESDRGKAGAQRSWQKGKDLLKDAREHVLKSRRDGSRLESARAAIAAAIDQLQDAKKVLGGNVDIDLKSALEESENVVKAMRPLEVEFRSAADLKGWSFEKGHWVSRSRDGQTWVQPNDVAVTTLTSPRLAFPRDFEVEIHFGVMGLKGDFRNSFFRGSSDPLTLRLVSDGGDDVTVALGRDKDSFSIEPAARIVVGKKSYEINAVSKHKGPIVLRFVRRRESATIEIGEKTIPSFQLSDDFRQIVITARSVQDYKNRLIAFPALFKISVRHYGLGADKSSRLDRGKTGEKATLTLARLPASGLSVVAPCFSFHHSRTFSSGPTTDAFFKTGHQVPQNIRPDG